MNKCNSEKELDYKTKNCRRGKKSKGNNKSSCFCNGKGVVISAGTGFPSRKVPCPECDNSEDEK